MKKNFFSGIFIRCQSTRPFRYHYDINNLYHNNYNNVPLLPLPKLEDTLRSYRRSIVPLASSIELGDADRDIEMFFKHEGQVLHNDLMKLEDSTAAKGNYPYSYVEKYWDQMYLGGRWATPINGNPFYILKREGEFSGPLNRASKFVNASVMFWLKVVQGELEADVDPSGKPLCMYQFSNMLGTTRVPGKLTDTHIYNQFSEHIVVACRSRYYKLQVIVNGKPVKAEQIEHELGLIENHAASQAVSDFDVGYMTAQQRDIVYELRQDLERSELNRKSLDIIDRSLFVLTIDENANDDINHLAKIGLTGVHGDSRWFDKHNIIVDRNSDILINFEHATGDGLTWNRWLVEAWYNMNSLINEKYPYAPFREDNVEVEASLFEVLEFEFDDSTRKKFELAKVEFIRNIENIDYDVLEFDTFGKAKAKQWKVSPDALSQMAMQLGFHFATKPNEHNLRFRGVPVYEACAMKNYFHGRTETIRSCSFQSTEMSRIFLEQSSSSESKATYFKQACATHVDIARGAKSCIGEFMGVDRHLYALKCLAQEQGMDIQKISFFSNALFTRSSTWILSTSNVTTPFFRLFGFGPTASAGFGIGYQTFDKELPFCIASFKDSQQSTSKEYSNGIVRALSEFLKTMN